VNKWWFLAGGVLIGVIVAPKLRAILPVSLPSYNGGR
jgi:hypothetical protein